jgi:hypothetical protein
MPIYQCRSGHLADACTAHISPSVVGKDPDLPIDLTSYDARVPEFDLCYALAIARVPLSRGAVWPARAPALIIELFGVSIEVVRPLRLVSGRKRRQLLLGRYRPAPSDLSLLVSVWAVRGQVGCARIRIYSLGRPLDDPSIGGETGGTGQTIRDLRNVGRV